MKTTLILLTASAASSIAAVNVLHEYKLGEAGSLGGGNSPLDTVGSVNFPSAIQGPSATVETDGVFAPASTAYLSTSSATNTGWYGAGFGSTVPSDNFGFGIYTRAATLTGNTSDILVSGGLNDSFKLSLATNGWGASADNRSWIGPAQGVSGSFTANEWVHLALVRQNGSTTFYIDRVAQGGSYAGEPVHGSGHLAVESNATAFFDGDIDEARFVTFDGTDSIEDILNGIQAIPEPSSTALLGLAGLTLLTRRKR